MRTAPILSARRARGSLHFCRGAKSPTILRRSILIFFAFLVFYAVSTSLALTFGNNAAAAPTKSGGPVPVTPTVLSEAAASAQSKQALSPSLSPIEKEWLAARSAFERRDVPTLAAAKDRFQSRPDFVLSPYVTFWWINAQLAQSAQSARALDSDIERLASAYPEAPFTELLRRDYLRALGRIDAWPQFGRIQGSYAGDDSEVACQRLRFRATSDFANAADDAKSLFALAKPAAMACYDLFEKLVKARVITQDELWRRARTLFDAGSLVDARRTTALIPGLKSGFEAASANANLDPRHFLQKTVVQASDRAQVELTLLAITRLARTNTEAAVFWLEKNQSHLPPAALAHAWAQIAYHAAMQLQPEALNWFAKATDTAAYTLNDQQAGWRVRAALRATAADPSQWVVVRKTISQMSEQERREPVWRYWLARAMATSALPADQAAVRAAREQLARENHFYAVLAAEELGQLTAPSFMGHLPSNESIARVTERHAVKRAFALYRLAELKPDAKDLRNDALREWVSAMRNADDETLLAGAEAARRQGLPDRAINTAERTKSLHDFAQRFPLPHRDTLQSQASTFGVDEAWVFGLIRQESRFMVDARSSVGAIGLMQLMPATAKWAAQQVGIKDFSLTRVADVDINLSLGTFYLKHVLDDLGHPVLATAAYNAGPGRARRWRASTPLEGAIYAESIPFNETRDYVKKVMLNKWYYQHRLNGKSLPLSQLMGSVPAKNSARIAAVTSAPSVLLTSAGGR